MIEPTRRALLRGLAAAAALGACRTPMPARTVSRLDAGKRLRVLLDDPLCAEAAAEHLVTRWITPVRDFYVLDHGDAPDLDPRRFELVVDGAVRRRLRLRLDDLDALPAVAVPATLMCAGNRRLEHHRRRPVDEEVLWGPGAIGNALWTGVRLADVLREAGVGAGASHVRFDGADRTPRGHFGGSIPLARVLDRDLPPVVLATGMNGRRLPRVHGAPLRAIVPGAIGARSVKWLRRIEVAERPSTNPHFVIGHRDGDDRPLWHLPINSAICAVDGTRIAGYAIARGDRAVVAVEVSVDGGRRWTEARLDDEVEPACWRLWRAELVVAGAREVVARAIDSAGAVQPRVSPWNPTGYLYHGWARAPLRR